MLVARNLLVTFLFVYEIRKALQFLRPLPRKPRKHRLPPHWRASITRGSRIHPRLPD